MAARRTITRFAWAALLALAASPSSSSALARHPLDDALAEPAFVESLIEMGLEDALDHLLDQAAADALDPALRDRARLAVLRVRARDALGDPAVAWPAVARLLSTGAAIAQSARFASYAPADRARIHADLAEDAYFLRLVGGGLEPLLLFGIPTEPQHIVAADAASSIAQHSAAAMNEVASAIAALEADPAYRDDPLLQARRQQLAQDERDRRIAFLRGVSAYLDARGLTKVAGALEGAAPADDDALRRLADRRLDPLESDLDPAIARRAALYRGLALADLGRFEEAEERFRTVATDEEAGEYEVLMARLGGVRNRLVNRGPESAEQAIRSIEGRYEAPGPRRDLLAGAALRVGLAHARDVRPSDSRRADTLMIDALRRFIRMMRVGPDDAPAWDRRLLARARLARVLTDPLPTHPPAPTLAILARTERLLTQENEPDRALAVLRPLLERTDLLPTDAADALDLAARSAGVQGDLRAAADFALELLSRHPGSPQADAALGWIQRAVAASPDAHPEGFRDDLLAAARSVQRRGVDGDRADALRLLVARLDLLAREPDAALAVLDDIESVGPNGRAADRLRIDVLLLQLRLVRDEAGRAERAARALLDALDAAAANADGENEGVKALALRLPRAEALAALGRWEDALRVLEQAPELPSTAGVPPRLSAQLMAARIDALRNLGRSQEAEAIVADLAATGDAAAGAVLEGLLRDLLRSARRLIDQGDRTAADSVLHDRALPIVDALDRWSDDGGSVLSPTHQLLMADVLRLAGRHEQALARYDAVETSLSQTVPTAFGRAVALQRIGGIDNLAAAMRLYRQLASTLSREADAWRYWRVQLGMMQILDAVDRNTEKIGPRIRRLRAEDPGLGGPALRPQFEALERRHGGAAGR